jgi:outer membrane protein insertion porin family
MNGPFLKILLSTAMFLLPFFASAGAWAVIEEIDVEGLSSISSRELLYLLDLRKGDTLDPLKVRLGIKRAFLKEIFDDIQVYGNEELSRIRVVAVERVRIRKIIFKGNDHISDRTAKMLFPVSEGQVLRPGLLENAAAQMERSMAERGFTGASVSTAISPTSNPVARDVVVTIREGKPPLIETIQIAGEPEELIRRLLSLREGGIYDPEKAKKDLEDIKAYFRKSDYLNPRVSLSFRNGKLEVSVTKGERLIIQFKGNSYHSAKKLLKETSFFSAGELRDDLIEDAVREILSLYHAKGFAFAQVVPVLSRPEESPADTRMITFYIYEGERIEVRAIRFPGMTLPEKNLKDALPLGEGDDYNPELLSGDADVVKEFYIALGYLNAETGEPDITIAKGEATITIPVKGGLKTLIEQVKVMGTVSIPSEEILRVMRLKKGNPYNEVDIADARSRCIEYYLDRGYLDVTANAKVEFSDSGAFITFEIHEGEQTFFGKTIITGNKKTRREVITRELLHQESAPFDANLLVKERQRLYKLGLFTDVRIEGLDRYDHTEDVHIDVVEGKAGLVDFGIGYNTLEKLTGSIDVSYKNLFGMNRQISFRVLYNSLEKIFAINYYQPWFLNSNLLFKGQLLHQEKDAKNIDTGVIMYRFRKQGLSAGMERQFSPEFKGEFLYELVFYDTTDVQPDIILTSHDTGKLKIMSLGPGIAYDTRDNVFDPRRGVLAGLNLKIAPFGLVSDTTFVKAILSGSTYHELSRYFVVALSARLGAAHGWGETTILPLVERFFLGGRNTVRAYAQDTLGPRGVNNNPTGGNAFFLTNVELRTFLGKGFGLVTFLDSGNVWQRIADIDLSIRHGVGAGLRYNTPVGPLRLDYGYKLRKEPGLKRSEIFFSIGQAF